MRKYLMLAFGLLLVSAVQAKEESKNPFAGIEFRSIGPALTSGRISDIAIDPVNPNTWFITIASGGIWKTINEALDYCRKTNSPAMILYKVITDEVLFFVVFSKRFQCAHNRKKRRHEQGKMILQVSISLCPAFFITFFIAFFIAGTLKVNRPNSTSD